jgi:hypothetical protein
LTITSRESQLPIPDMAQECLADRVHSGLFRQQPLAASRNITRA